MTDARARSQRRWVITVASLMAMLPAAGCGSSSSGAETQPASTSAPPAAAAPSPTVSPKAAYARAQADALKTVDAASGEVLYLNPATTGVGVLGQKIHTLTDAIRAAARDLSHLHPPADAGALQRREVTQLRAYARELDAWVKTHPKRTVAGASDVVHGGREGLDRTIDALGAKGLVD
jgi:hypothetical protein